MLKIMKPAKSSISGTFILLWHVLHCTGHFSWIGGSDVHVSCFMTILSHFGFIIFSMTLRSFFQSCRNLSVLSDILSMGLVFENTTLLVQMSRYDEPFSSNKKPMKRKTCISVARQGNFYPRQPNFNLPVRNSSTGFRIFDSATFFANLFVRINWSLG